MRRRNKMPFFPFILFLAVFLCLVEAPFLKSFSYAEEINAKEKTYTFLIQVSRIGEIDKIDAVELLKKIKDDFYEQTGIRIIVKDISYRDWDGEFIKSNADFAFFTIDDLINLRLINVEIEPLVLASMFKKPSLRVCFYADDKHVDIKSFKGASICIANNSIGHYVAARKLLFDNGIDLPLERYFGKTYNSPDTFQALLLGKVQVVADNDWAYKYSSINIPQIKSIKPLACTDDYPSIGIYMRKGISSDDITKIRTYLKKLHKNQKLKEIRTFIIALDLKFVDPDQILMQRFESIYKQSIEKGWLDEAIDFNKRIEEIPKGQILKLKKRTYKECKEQCKIDKNKESCIEKCLGE